MYKTYRSGIYAHITVSEQWQDKQIEALLRDELRVPKKLMHSWRMKKSVLLNNEPVKWTTEVQQNNCLSLPVYNPEMPSAKSLQRSLDVLYEDDDLLVVNKPPHLNTHPVTDEDNDSLLNAVTAYLNKNIFAVNPRHIHRLDKDTSGAILFAKHAYAAAILDKALAEGRIKRTYAALVDGKMKKDHGTISAPIGRDRHMAGKMRVSQTGKPAVTHFTVMKRFTSENTTLVSCRLETGRTHQIRVHMSYIGHPLAGDTMYGGKVNRKLNRQALHAYRLDFVHPLTNEALHVECPIPFARV